MSCGILMVSEGLPGSGNGDVGWKGERTVAGGGGR